jgi:N-hydroxyarylamine O-acetyltransferase
MERAAADAYLDRLGAARPASPDAAALRALHRRHQVAVPFENLSVTFGEEILLEEDALHDKIVARRRGGFCYELNGLFAALLRHLGFEVTLHAARVFDGDRPGIPFDHMALWVRAGDGSRWLADVGFGRHSVHPLRLEDRTDQADAGGAFRLAGAGGPDGDLDVLRDGTPQYRMEDRPRALADFRAGCWWHRTSPQSHFTRGTVCSRLTEEGGRVTLSGRTLVTTGADGVRREHEVPAGGVLAAYREHFGLELDREPPLGP